MSAILWGDAFAPITSAIGFLRAPWDEVADPMTQWRRTIPGWAKAERLAGRLRDHIESLPPLTTAVSARELTDATANPEFSEARERYGIAPQAVGGTKPDEVVS